MPVTLPGLYEGTDTEVLIAVYTIAAYAVGYGIDLLSKHKICVVAMCDVL